MDDAHDVELDAQESDPAERSALRRGLLDPIEETERRAADESAVLLANSGRSWGP